MTWVVEHSARAVLACLVPVFIWSCGAGKPYTNDDETGGSTSIAARGGTGSGAVGGGGSSSGGVGTGGTEIATGGMSGSGGTSGEGTTGGTGAEAGTSVGGGAGTGGDTGTGGSVAAGSGGMAGAAGGPGVCQELSVVPTPQVPIVTILVDTSSSMWQTVPPTWPLLYDALMNEEDGVVPALASSVRFGFASFKGLTSDGVHEEDDVACAEMPTVEPAYDNAAAIDAVYAPIDWTGSEGTWETPTAHAIARTTAALADLTLDPAGPKFILLLTDGNPNTCQVLNPQCGQDRAVKAAQDAYAAGVGLFVMGVGDVVTNPNAGCPTSARCGVQHLQDMANAGVGAPVQPPPATFVYEQCNQGELLATYTADAPDVGTPFAVDTRNQDAKDELISTLTGLLANVISCTVEMDARVTGDPALGTVSVGGTPVAYGGADGWSLDMATLYNVTLQGSACETFKAGATLDIQFPCDPSGKPIAVRR